MAVADSSTELCITNLTAGSPVVSGIYTITNSVSGRLYVGQAVNIYFRWCTHKSQLRSGTHHCEPLQRAWRKYGENAFQFICIETILHDQLDRREQDLIDLYVASGTREMLYNVALFVQGSARGLKRSEETCRRLSEMQRGEKNHAWGKKPTPEHKAKLSIAQRGWIRRPECWLPAVLANTGKPKSVEARAKMAAAKIGKPQSQAHLAKRILAMSGGKNWKAFQVECVETGQIFESAACAAKWLRENGHPKASHTAISLVRAGKREWAYGFHWTGPTLKTREK